MTDIFFYNGSSVKDLTVPIIMILETEGHNMVVKVQTLDSEDLDPNYSSAISRTLEFSRHSFLLTSYMLSTLDKAQHTGSASNMSLLLRFYSLLHFAYFAYMCVCVCSNTYACLM